MTAQNNSNKNNKTTFSAIDASIAPMTLSFLAINTHKKNHRLLSTIFFMLGLLVTLRLSHH